MKKLTVILLIIVGILSLVGCSSGSKEKDNYNLYIEPAQLTEEEEKIADLLGVGDNFKIYDFVLDDTVQCIQVNTYRLADGEWKLVSGGGGRAFTDKNGRIALEFKKLAEGLGVTIQSENTGGGESYQAEVDEELKQLESYGTSALSNKTEIIYEEEIPLILQVMTSQNSCHVYQVEEGFYNPERYEELGYEAVYAVTIRFSQKTVAEMDELDNDNCYKKEE